MLTGIDHLVLAVADPDEVTARLEDELGLAASGGGRHRALGTFNRLVWLGDAYLELIGVFDRAVAAESWLGRPTLAALEMGRALATWAIATDDLDADLAAIRSEHFGWLGPLDGERRRPDGAIVRWRLAHPPSLGPASPFLIEHDETAAEWTPEERAARRRLRHPIGGHVRLEGLTLAGDAEMVDDLGRALAAVLPRRPSPDGLKIGAQLVAQAATTTVRLRVDAPAAPRAARIADVDLIVAADPPRSRRRLDAASGPCQD